MVVFLTVYLASFGDLFEGTPFYTGTLLAELSLLYSSSTPASSLRASSQRFHFRFCNLKGSWPIALALFALFLGSYPYNSPELKSYSRFLTYVGEVLFPSHCNP